MYHMTLDTPTGEMLLVGDGRALCGMYWSASRGAHKAALGGEENREVFARVVQELSEYFAGRRRRFTFAISFQGTSFQKAVWQRVAQIPFGEVTTYGAIAKDIDNPLAVRAVGTAVGANPLPIVVPCHRVLPGTGRLGQFGGGTAAKAFLLALEGHEKFGPHLRGGAQRR